MSKISAGFLPYRKTEDGLEFFLVHPAGPFYAKRDEGVWSIPKGETEGEENLIERAKKEFKEETGQDAPIVHYIELGSVKKKDGKIIHVWTFEADLQPPFTSNHFEMEWPPRSGKKQSFPEVDKWEYFNEMTAKKKISPAQAELIDRLIEKLS